MFNYLSRRSIRTKIWFIVSLSVMGIIATSLSNILGHKSDLLEEKKLKTRHLVESAHSVLTQFYDAEKSGSISRDEAQAAALRTIKGMRYEKTEYYWVHDLTAPVPKMIMHPTVPALDGKVLDAEKFNSATSIQAGINGKVVPVTKQNLFVSFNVAVNEAGHGYVTYDWPKPLPGGGASKELYPKLSYIKKFDGWDWVMGSGIYIDDLEALFWEKVQNEILRALILTAVILAIATLIGRTIIRPLDQTAVAMHDISQGDGDLSKRLPTLAVGVMARLAEGFNCFSSKIEKTIVEVSVSTVQLSGATAQLSEVANQTVRGVQHQQREIRQVALAVNEMSAKVGAVEHHAHDAAQAADLADAEARHGKQVVDETIASINTLATEVQRATEVIQSLENDSKGIGSILDTIRGIADQTNLLALNAAIEAARAGEQGRGFAVVADEVRTLALRTQEATGKIQDMIGGLQSEAQHAAKVMQEGRVRTEATVNQAAMAGESLEKITRVVATISEMNSHIAQAAREQSQVASTINDSIAGISAVAEQTADGAQDTQSAVGALADMMAKLQNLVRQFKTRHDKGAFDFNAAKAAHLAWKARLRSFLDGQSTLTMEQAVSHHHCVLGKWYYSDGLAKYGHIPEMKQIEDPHAELHRTIKDIVQARQGGNAEQAETLYTKIEPISRQIIGLLGAVEAKVKSAS